MDLQGRSTFSLFNNHGRVFGPPQGAGTAMRAGQEFQSLAGRQASVREAKKNPVEAMKKAFD